MRRKRKRENISNEEKDNYDLMRATKMIPPNELGLVRGMRRKSRRESLVMRMWIKTLVTSSTKDTKRRREKNCSAGNN